MRYTAVTCWSYRLFLFFASLELIYVIAANTLLNTRLLQNLIDSSREEIRIEYKLAYSIIPGYVSIRGLKFLIQDNNIQMFFTMSSTNVTIDLVSLFRREFHTTKVKGNNLSFLLRFRRSKEELQKTQLKALPYIPWVKGIDKKAELYVASSSPQWKVRLDGVDINSMHELWFEEFHFTGEALVQGGFFIYPQNKLEVIPSILKFKNGEAVVNGGKVLTGIKGNVTTSIPIFDLKNTLDSEIFKMIDARVNLQAEVKSVTFLNYYLKDIPWLTLEDGGGHLFSDLIIKFGKVQSKSKLDIETSNLKAHIWNQTANGSGIVSWGVVSEDLTRLAMKFEKYELRPPSPVAGMIQGKNLNIVAESPSLDLTKPLQKLSVTLDLPEAEITNLTYLNSYFPKLSSLKLMGGTGKIHGSLRIFTASNNKDSGQIYANGNGISVQYKKLNYRGNIQLKIAINHSQLDDGMVNVSGSHILLKDFVEDPASKTLTLWQASFLLSNAVFRYGTDHAFGSNIYLKSSNARPIVALYLASQNTTLPEWLKNVLAFDDLLLKLRFDINEKNLKLGLVHATGKNTDLKGWLKSKEDRKIGRWLLEYGPLAAGIELIDSKSNLKLNDAISWYHR